MSEARPGEGPLIDRDVLDDLVAHIGVDAARSVIEMYLGEARDFVNRITTAPADAAGRDIARKAAHSLKSSSGQLGAAAVAVAAEQLEHAAMQGVGDLAALVAALRHRVDDTENALTEMLRAGR